ncbi:EAL domain-containing protein [Proteobacteria bacterium 005FR1]|nr:EAL domain-containing protein [Proteobacteria bacterium 005FR1]
MVSDNNNNNHAPREAAAPAWDSLQDILGLAADWVWETDTEGRFTRLAGAVLEADADISNDQLLGGTRWELNLEPIAEQGSWDDHRKLLLARLPFRRLVLRRSQTDGKDRFLSISGTPCYDSEGRWTGYRGTGQDITDAHERFIVDERLKAIVDASPDTIFLADKESQRFVYVNEAACRMTGFKREELLRMCGYHLTGRPREEAAALYQAAVEAGAQGVTQGVHMAASRDGKRKGWWEPHHRAVEVEGRWMVVTVSREVSSRILAERSLIRAKRMYAALSSTSNTIMRAKTPDELYQGLCDAAVDAGGVASAAVLLADESTGNLRPAAIAGAGKNLMHKFVISVAPDRPEGQGLNGIAYRSGEPCVSNDFQNDPRTALWHKAAEKMRLKSGASVPISRNGRAIGVLYLCSDDKRTFDEEVVSLLQQMTDNLAFGLQTLEHEMDREKAEERVRYLATHDSLTGLPNRALFGELLEQATAMARRYHQRLAVMFIDLDRFKYVNDTLGHAAGDVLLKEMTARLKSRLRDSDVLARLGGDEFVVLLPNITTAGDAAVVARKLLNAAIEPILIMGQECRVTASIGVSLFPDHGEDHADLMKNSDTAMYVAKEKGKNTFEFFVPGMQAQSSERLALETGLRQALQNDEFYLHFQAKLDLKTKKINGVEALLRWTHPTLGNVPPQQFIPICEKNGSIITIGRWVLKNACKQNVEWQHQGLPPITMAVNLSPVQFADPDLLQDIRGALDESGMSPHLLELELTESMVMINPLRTIEILSELRNLGVRIALDDFGVGYSSLAQIKGFPIDTLKVDRSFIRNLPESDQDRAITEAIINMARSLSLTVVAEGVETEAQENFLRNLACDESQGFYFSKPAAPEEISELLRTHSEVREADDD